MTLPRDPEFAIERVVSAHEGSFQRAVPWLIKETQAEELEDLIISEVGERRRREACRAFGGVIGASPGGIDGYNDGVYDDFLVGVWGSLVYNSDGANAEWNQIASGVSLISGLLHQVVRGQQGGNNAIAICACEGVTSTSEGIKGRSQLVVYDVEADSGTQVSLGPRCIEYAQNRLFYGVDETIGWSEIAALADISEANQLNAEPGVGGEITAILAARDTDSRLWIFKEDAILLFRPKWGSDAEIPTAGDALDTANSFLLTLTRGVGCIATKTAIWVPGAEGADVFFLARDGVRSLQRAENDTQTGAGFPLSYDIPLWINRINFSAAHKAVASVFDNAYHLAVPMDGATDNTHMLRFDIRNRSWSLHKLQPRDLSSFRVSGEDRMWMQNMFATGDSSVTDAETNVSNYPFQVFSVFEGDQDPSTDITNPARVDFREVSRAVVFGNPNARKRWDYFSAQVASADTSRMEVAYRIDRGGWVTLTEVVVPGSSGTIIFGEEPLPWQSSEELIRKFSWSLGDAPPGFALQMRLMAPTDQTESGQLHVYTQAFRAHVFSEKFDSP